MYSKYFFFHKLFKIQKINLFLLNIEFEIIFFK